jgi:transcriptional regulator with XRE-family HTH domain
MTEEELHAIFCSNLKEYRNARHWSQSALAKETGVSINFINDLELGKKWASPATMIKIANIFNIEVYELLKPPGLLPDTINSVIKKYTDHVHEALEQARSDFLKNSTADKKSEKTPLTHS